MNHYEKFATLHELVSIVLQLTNQVEVKFLEKSCDVWAVVSKISLETRLLDTPLTGNFERAISFLFWR